MILPMAQDIEELPFDGPYMFMNNRQLYSRYIGQEEDGGNFLLEVAESIDINRLSEEAQLVLKLILLKPEDMIGSWLMGDVQALMIAVFHEYVKGRTTILPKILQELRFAKKVCARSDFCDMIGVPSGNCSQKQKPTTIRRIIMGIDFKKLAEGVSKSDLRKHAKALNIKSAKKKPEVLVKEVVDEIKVRFDNKEFDDEHPLIVWNNALNWEAAEEDAPDANAIEAAKKKKAAVRKKKKETATGTKSSKGVVNAAVLEAIKNAKAAGISRGDIITATGLGDGSVRNAIYKLKKDGTVVLVGKGLFAAA